MSLRFLLQITTAVVGLGTPAFAQLDGSGDAGSLLTIDQTANDPSLALISAVPTASSDETVSTLGLVVSALDDLNSGTILASYSGASFGPSGQGLTVSTTLPIPAGPWGTWSGGDSRLTTPGIIGVSVPIADQLAVLLDDQYKRELDLELNSTLNQASIIDVQDEQMGLSALAMTEATSNTLLFASTPQAPMIEPIAQTSFVIFFDWDSASLSADANDVLDTVVVVASETGVASLLLDSHSDLSGSATYNQDLSQRRAGSVADGLIARGMAPEEIIIRVFGEENPATSGQDVMGQSPARKIEIIVS